MRNFYELKSVEVRLMDKHFTAGAPEWVNAVIAATPGQKYTHDGITYEAVRVTPQKPGGSRPPCPRSGRNSNQS